MFPHMFKEELGSLLCCCSLLAWYEYIHIGKYVDYYYYHIMLMFGSRISRQIVHRNRFSWSTRNSKGCLQSLLSIQWFSNGTNHARFNVLVDVRFKWRSVKLVLEDNKCFCNSKMSCSLIVVHAPNDPLLVLTDWYKKCPSLYSKGSLRK